jgi:viroplasmin and RNaseH domain-containing protein
MDPKVQAATSPGADRSSDHLAIVHSSKNLTPENRLRAIEDMSTGDEFQNKLEDDLYEKKVESTDDKFGDLLGKICLTALAITFVFACIVGCIALAKAVF